MTLQIPPEWQSPVPLPTVQPRGRALGAVVSFFLPGVVTE